jgi:ankyrin repeat protein
MRGLGTTVESMHCFCRITGEGWESHGAVSFAVEPSLAETVFTSTRRFFGWWLRTTRQDNGRSTLRIHDLASIGDREGVCNELGQGASVEARDNADYTPLAHAARSSAADVQMLRLLIAARADVNASVDEDKKYPVGLAACSASFEKVQVLLDAGADINFESPAGYTVLINVVYSLSNSEQLVPFAEFLVRSGASLNCETKYGESPLSVTARFGRFDAVKFLLEAGADPAPLQWTPMLSAAAIGTLNELRILLIKRSGIDGRDRWDRTPWLLAVLANDIEKAKLLLEAGASINERGRGGYSALMYCAEKGSAEMLRWLLEIGADIDAADGSGNTALMLAAQAGATECVQLLLKAGASPSRTNEYDSNAMSMASNEPIIRLLADAGEPISQINTEMKRILTGLEGGDRLNISEAEYKSGCRRRFGRANPEVMNIPFWRAMVRAGISAYEAKAQFGDTDSMEPTWCYSRYGTSFTELPDGRFVQIGGEHEDFYDPDFCIYNDVVINERSGNLEIMGYPSEVFPPTDFHSATLVDGQIYIVGGLGYSGSREFGTTPIYRLDCRTWKIEPLKSDGDNPGWIYDHRATLSQPSSLLITGGKVCQEIDGEEQTVDNPGRFCLNLSDMRWSRILLGASHPEIPRL